MNKPSPPAKSKPRSSRSRPRGLSEPVFDAPTSAKQLRNFPLLSALTDGELDTIFARLTFEPDFLGQIGARTTVDEVRFTLVLSGSYRVVAVSAEGAKVTLREIGPGGFFGEMGILASKAPGN